MSLIRNSLLVLAALALPTAVRAETSPGREGLKQFCSGDYLEHCSEHPPGGPEVEACFRAKIRQLSPGCVTAITAFKREQKANPRLTQAR